MELFNQTVVVQTFNPNTQEVEFKASLVYTLSSRPARVTVRPHLKEKKQTDNKTKVNYQAEPCEMVRIFILCVLFSGVPQHILCETSLMEALLAGVGVSSCSTHHALTLNRTALKLKFQDKFGRGHTHIHRWQNCELLTN